VRYTAADQTRLVSLVKTGYF